MSDIDDAIEFIESAENFSSTKGTSADALKRLAQNFEQEDIEVKPGQPVQYSIYGSGYTATSQTIQTLPSGCYDIQADERCVFVTPAMPPSGLLLELPEMRSEEVIRIVDTFWNSEKDYKEGNEFVIGGATYKAGIMIYGPPGSGKSCTIKLLSKKLVERQGTVFYANGHPAHVMRFLTDFSKIETNRKCIVIFEDIDTLIHCYGEHIYLELLDSAKTIDNVLFIATTNYPDRLDPRIYNRPGRFSHLIKIGLPSEVTRRAYLKAILKNHRDVDEIVRETQNFTIDHLTSLVNAVYREKKELHSEIKRLRALFKVPKVEETGSLRIGGSDD